MGNRVLSGKSGHCVFTFVSGKRKFPFFNGIKTRQDMGKGTLGVANAFEIFPSMIFFSLPLKKKRVK